MISYALEYLKKIAVYDKCEIMTLLEEMKQALPIPVNPGKEFYRFLRKKEKHIEKDREINIIGVFDSGDMGGIVCALDFDKKEVFVISLTHLIIKPNHPLSDKITAYQKKRIKSLQGGRNNPEYQ